MSFVSLNERIPYWEPLRESPRPQLANATDGIRGGNGPTDLRRIASPEPEEGDIAVRWGPMPSCRADIRSTFASTSCRGTPDLSGPHLPPYPGSTSCHGSGLWHSPSVRCSMIRMSWNSPGPGPVRVRQSPIPLPVEPLSVRTQRYKISGNHIFYIVESFQDHDRSHP